MPGDNAPSALLLMNAIILAAGFGRRMRPLTDHTHKTLIEVGGETVLARIVKAVLDQDVADITIVTGYRAEDLQAHLAKRFPARKFNWVHNAAYATTNNIVSLHLAMEALPAGTDALIIESDLLFDPAILARLMANPQPNVAVVDRHRPGLDGTVVTVEDGLVTGIIPPHLQGARFDFSDKFKTLNIYKFGAEFCDRSLRRLLDFYVKAVSDNCYYELILGVMIYMGSGRIHAEIVGDERWEEIDDPNDLDVARFVFEPAGRRARLDAAHGGLWNYPVTDFHYLANVYFPSAAVRSELRNSLDGAIANYGSCQVILDTKLAYYLCCPAERVALLNGLAQVYPFLRERFAGRRALVPAPTFGEYARAFPEAETYADSVGVDFAEVEAQAEGCDVVVFVNPNNPTGTWVETGRILAFARKHAGKTVIVDESFVDFSRHASVQDSLEAEPLANVVVLKSLGKSLGAPGLRLGYVYANDAELLRDLRSWLPVWSTHSLAEIFLEVILKHRGDIERSFRQTRADRDALAEALARHPAVERTWPSEGNFILARLALPAERLGVLLDALLDRHGLYLKDVSAKLNPPGAWVRVAVRTPEDNARLLAALAAEASPAAEGCA